MPDKKQICFQCETKTKEDDLTEIDNNLYCEDCKGKLFIICEDCQEYENSNNYHLTNHENFICDPCYQTSYFTCDVCSEVQHQDNYGQNGLCNNCYNDDDGNDNEQNIELNKYYNIKNSTKKLKNLPVAVEIEAENGNYDDTFYEIQNKNLGCGITHDGSLDDDGFEVQTPPAKIKELKKIVKEVCKILNHNGYTATKACGLHCHIGLNGSSDEMLANIFKTFTVIEPVLFSLVALSRRQNRYCKKMYEIDRNFVWEKIKDKNIIELLRAYYANNDNKKRENYKKQNYTIKKLKHNFTDKYETVRYCWVNWHSFIYRNTIEIRLHHGSTQPTKIINWAELLLLVVNWARFNYEKTILEYLASIENENELRKLQVFCRLFKIKKTLRQDLINKYLKYN